MDTINIGSKLSYDLIINIDDTKYTIIGALSNKKNVNQVNFMIAPGAIGITKIPVEFWEAWTKRNVGFPPLDNGLIFAQENKKELIAEAKDKVSLKTGLERTSQNKIKTNKDENGIERSERL